MRAAAVSTAVAVGVTTVFAAGGGTAAAATPYALAVGRFLDGAAGGMPIQALVDVQEAQASAPDNPSSVNPLNVTLLGQASVPVGKQLQLPSGGVFHLGAVNQIAYAHAGGASYGASGAVSRSGGIALGGRGKYPADATIDLSGAALGKVSIPGIPAIPGIGSIKGLGNLLPIPGVKHVPGVPNAAALGGVQATIGAISATARTKQGGTLLAPNYQIAGLTLSIGSPALGGLLQQLAAGGQSVDGLIQQVDELLRAIPGSSGFTSKGCDLTTGAIPSTLRLDDGAVVLDTAKATITVDVAKLLQQIGANLNTLPPNTDLLAYLVNNLPRILSHGLESVVNGITGPLEKVGTQCLGALKSVPEPLKSLLSETLATLEQGQGQLESAINDIADQLGDAGSSGLRTLTDQLTNAIAIGVNVQQGAYPLAGARSPKFRYTSALAATPDQDTQAVTGQGVERALEIDLAGGQAASLALGNAAAGPSTAPTPPSTPPTTSTPPPVTTVPPTNIPTGVPAGMAGHPGSPVLPLVLLLVGMTAAGGAALAYRHRGRFTR